jgi:flagellar biosynthesis chaperone FliJ
MSFLDRVTKAVGEVVDRGKQEVDQFVRIQKINGEIGQIEKKIAEFKSQIQNTKQQAGEKALALVRAGAIASPDLTAFVDQITVIERHIAEEEAAVAGKKKDIEVIKAEHEAAAATPVAGGAAVPSVPASQPPAAPAAPAAAAGRCSACGAAIPGAGAFCPQCGAKQA